MNWYPTFGQIQQIVKSLVFYSVISISAKKREPIYLFCVDLFKAIVMEHYKTLGFSLILRLSELVVNLNNLYGYEGLTACFSFFQGKHTLFLNLISHHREGESRSTHRTLTHKARSQSHRLPWTRYRTSLTR